MMDPVLMDREADKAAGVVEFDEVVFEVVPHMAPNDTQSFCVEVRFRKNNVTVANVGGARALRVTDQLRLRGLDGRVFAKLTEH